MTANPAKKRSFGPEMPHSGAEKCRFGPTKPLFGSTISHFVEPILNFRSTISHFVEAILYFGETKSHIGEATRRFGSTISQFGSMIPRFAKQIRDHGVTRTWFGQSPEPRHPAEQPTSRTERPTSRAEWTTCKTEPMTGKATMKMPTGNSTKPTTALTMPHPHAVHLRRKSMKTNPELPTPTARTGLGRRDQPEYSAGMAACTRSLVGAAVASFASMTFAQASSITDLGVLRQQPRSYANAISADGQTLVGHSGTTRIGGYAFRWTVAQGLQELSSDVPLIATGVSADGNVVCGAGSTSQAFRWTPLGGLQYLQLSIPGYNLLASKVSAGGSTIVGYASSSGRPIQAAVWTGTSPGTLIPLPVNATSCQAFGVNADGSSIVGVGSTPQGTRGFLWSGLTTTIIDPIQPGGTATDARGVSADGSVVVGGAVIAGVGSRAFRWTAGSGAVNISTSLALPTGAYAVSSDGSVVVGTIASGSPNVAAFLWTQRLGMVNLNQFAPSRGVDLTGWVLQEALGVSADGRVIAGYGLHNNLIRAYRLELPYLECIADTDDGSGTGTPDGGVTIDDLLYYLTIFEAGDLRSDVDNGTSTGTPDGGVTIDDLLYYLQRFEAGC